MLLVIVKALSLNLESLSLVWTSLYQGRINYVNQVVPAGCATASNCLCHSRNHHPQYVELVDHRRGCSNKHGWCSEAPIDCGIDQLESSLLLNEFAGDHQYGAEEIGLVWWVFVSVIYANAECAILWLNKHPSRFPASCRSTSSTWTVIIIFCKGGKWVDSQ